MIHVTLEDRYQTRTYSFVQDAVVVGCAPDCDLVLEREGVAERHVQITLRDGAVYVDDVRRNRQATNPVEPGDVVRIAGIDLHISRVPLEPEDIVDEIERSLVNEIAARPDDPAPRLVYADWLDDHAQPARAEFLRVQLAANAATDANDPAFLEAAARLTELAPDVGIGWRSLVAITFVEGCPTQPARYQRREAMVAMELVCPMRWDKLAPTEHAGIRACSACNRTVTYCTSVSQARTVAQAGGCVAVDLGNKRDDWDLEPPMMVGRPSPPFSRYGRRS